jgi:hypothetical protein
MSVGEQWKKNIEKNNKQIANEKQTTISHGTTNMETSEIQQTHLTYNGEIYFFFFFYNFHAPLVFSTLLPNIYI